MCRYMDEKGLGTMLAVNRSAEVNLKNLLHADEKACKPGTHPGFETEKTWLLLI